MQIKPATKNLNGYTMMHSSSDMFEIAKPLQDLFNLTHFSYHKLYKNNTRVHLSTHADFIESFHHNKFYTFSSTSQPYECYQSGYYIVDNIMSDELKVIIEAANAIFDYSHALMIIKKNDHYCEFYYFSTQANNYSVNNFYLNNIDLFEKFILYFKSTATALLEKVKNERFIYPAQENGSLPLSRHIKNANANKTNFNNSVKLKRYIIPELNIWLTYREIECLSFIKKGYAVKAIAQTLNISPRTVETHINNLKLKLNKSSIHALVMFEDALNFVDKIL